MSLQIKNIHIPDNELRETFIRCSGPGGQNVNKVNSGVQLRFNVRDSDALPEAVRDRLLKIAGNRINREGDLVIDARNHRTQTGNRQEALFRLSEWIEAATRTPKPRKKTRISAAAKEKRLQEKRQRSEVKRNRRFGKNAKGPEFPALSF